MRPGTGLKARGSAGSALSNCARKCLKQPFLSFSPSGHLVSPALELWPVSSSSSPAGPAKPPTPDSFGAAVQMGNSVHHLPDSVGKYCPPGSALHSPPRPCPRRPRLAGGFGLEPAQHPGEPRESTGSVKEVGGAHSMDEGRAEPKHPLWQLFGLSPNTSGQRRCFRGSPKTRGIPTDASPT